MRSILALIAHWYFPRRQSVISTSMSAPEVVAALSSRTEPGGLLPYLFGGGKHPLYGTVDGPTFKVRVSRRGLMDSQSRPVLVGEVLPRTDGGATLSILLRLDYATQAFWLFWAGAVTIAAILFPVMAILGRAQNTFLIPVPFAMLGLGALMVVGSFEHDWKRLCATLNDVFVERPSNPNPS